MLNSSNGMPVETGPLWLADGVMNRDATRVTRRTA